MNQPVAAVELEEVSGFLAQHDPFSRLPEAQRVELARALRMRYVRRGEHIISAGEVNDYLYIVRSGAVDVLSADDVLVDRRDTGATCGYSTLVGVPESEYTMVIVEDALLLVLARAEFDQLCAAHPDLARFFDAQTRRTSAAVRELEEDSTELLRTRVRDIPLHAAPELGPDVTVQEAARAMTQHQASSLIVADGGAVVGIVTDRDLRARVLAADVPLDTPVAQIMTRNPVTLTPETMAMEAQLLMAEHNFHHVPVVEDGQLRGILTQADIAGLLQEDPIFVAANLARSTDVTDAFSHAARLAVRYIDRGSTPQEVANIITMVADAVARRVCALAEEELGPPPVPFAFVVVGSQGRREMGMASDQDNALVLDNSFDPAVHGQYFAEFGQRVCAGLARAGQELCPGEMMAANSQWRMTQAQWESAFHQWITAPQPDALLSAQVFFDMRTVYGAAELGAQVHAYAVSVAKGSRRLHAHLASLAARREPPLTFFRGLVVERDGQHVNTLDVKKGGTAGIVQMARLFALASGSTAVETQERLRAAAGDSVSTQGAKELADALTYLRSLTLQHQAEQVRAGQAPDYHIDPSALGRMDREHLRDAFRIIKSMQSALATKYPVRNV
ncbi:cyclic nucleotide-binding/CBS domain-containing protein [Corynebacterium lizhenjunii]|uniref:Cyclic nucleotide-binding/CBS domain-containing protein n=1 Tax=Corynebacterium lizhenjunii TaxID=2709394 RepID=A0A7T0PCT1_9CORY|nr:DUF294 nucleotidyltransferase-like domain-containing protein [Corynebacterium lizhenjunii]QPK80057.1 cyclic nucleotide-binding/CBS domain-containing protein [Corynebacterium lizhenjunii]